MFVRFSPDYLKTGYSWKLRNAAASVSGENREEPTDTVCDYVVGSNVPSAASSSASDCDAIATRAASESLKGDLQSEDLDLVLSNAIPSLTECDSDRETLLLQDGILSS